MNNNQYYDDNTTPASTHTNTTPASGSKAAPKKGSTVPKEILDKINSRNPDGSQRECVALGNQKVWIRKVDPNKIEECRTQVAMILAQDLSSVDETIEILKVLIKALKLGELEPPTKSGNVLVINNGEKRVETLETRWKFKGSGWIGSVKAVKSNDGSVSITMDNATIAHYKLFLRDLKTTTQEVIDKWNADVKKLKEERKARKSKKNWARDNTSVFNIKDAFNEL